MIEFLGRTDELAQLGNALSDSGERAIFVISGPGGIGFWPCAQGELGGYHQGFLHLTTILKRPSGVGYWLCPVATTKKRR